METILTSLITQLKNPWQYICVGLVWSGVLYFDIDKQYLIPFVIASLGFAYLLEQIITKIVLVIFRKAKDYFVAKKILETLRKCTSEEKDFLHNRVYENGNELRIDMYSDSYFYKRDENSFGYRVYLYKEKFNTKEKVGLFLRQLENKKIIKNFGNKDIIIPVPVWNVLVKCADEIFEDFKNLKFK